MQGQTWALQHARASAQYSTTPLLHHSFGYDAAGRLQPVTSDGKSATYSYLANSPLVGLIVFAQNGQTRMTTTKQYDSLNRLTAIENIVQGGAGVAPAPSFAYAYNAANQRVRAAFPDGSSWSYAYDELGEVMSANHSAADGTPVAGEQFGYAFDDIGNRLETTTSSQAMPTRRWLATYAANNLNQYSARTVPDDADPLGQSNPPETFQYDADGNLVQDAQWAYTWDGENRLVAMVSVGSPGPRSLLQFDYDWQGRRIRKRVWSNPAGNGNPVVDQRFLYDGWNLLATLNSRLSTINSFVWGLDLSGKPQGAGGVGGLLMVNDAVQGTHFVAFDGNGNVAALVKARDASFSATYEYSPFGEPLRGAGPMADVNPLRFSTKFTDGETGLLYYGHRNYNSGTGQWFSRDPIGEEASVNLYGFVGNNPIGTMDYLGQTPSDVALKFAGKQVGKTVGYQISGLCVAKVPGLSDLLGLPVGIGAQLSVMWFPDTCQFAAYAVTATLTNWLEGGLIATAGVGFEEAVYLVDSTPGNANPYSYKGPFYTMQASANIGPVPLSGSLFVGVPDPVTNGLWVGGSLGVGPGYGLAWVEWYYDFLVATPPIPTCLCYALTLAEP